MGCGTSKSVAVSPVSSHSNERATREQGSTAQQIIVQDVGSVRVPEPFVQEVVVEEAQLEVQGVAINKELQAVIQEVGMENNPSEEPMEGEADNPQSSVLDEQPETQTSQDPDQQKTNKDPEQQPTNEDPEQQPEQQPTRSSDEAMKVESVHSLEAGTKDKPIMQETAPTNETPSSPDDLLPNDLPADKSSETAQETSEKPVEEEATSTDNQQSDEVTAVSKEPSVNEIPVLGDDDNNTATEESPATESESPPQETSELSAPEASTQENDEKSADTPGQASEAPVAADEEKTSPTEESPTEEKTSPSSNDKTSVANEEASNEPPVVDDSNQDKGIGENAKGSPTLSKKTEDSDSRKIEVDHMTGQSSTAELAEGTAA